MRLPISSVRRASLRGPDGQHDGQAAADQDGGIGGAQSDVESFAGGGEVAEISRR